MKIDPTKEYPKKSLKEMETKDNKKIIKILKTCMDPELGVDVWSLELIYDIIVKGKDVEIVMTFTTPLCPYGPQFVEDIKSSLKKKNYNSNITIVFYPRWKPTDRIKEIFGISDG